jgi:hypothetical protein
MTTQTTTLERLLLDDLDVDGERAADEKSAPTSTARWPATCGATTAIPRAG